MPIQPNVHAIVLAALEKADPGARAAYVEEACAGDGELPQRVESLLRAHETGAALPETPGEAPTVAPPPSGADSGSSPTLGLEPPPAGVGTRVRYVGDYELLEEIARGGMGVVFRARQVSLNRIVALKMILAGQLASEADVQRFKTEAEAAANLDHPNIVPIYEVGEHAGMHYFSMKFIDGGRLAAGRGLTPGDLRAGVKLLATVASAVHHAHQRGILHRDLKPANILVDKHGEPHVTDFGLAKRVSGGGELTQSGAIVGTPSYMAPEQARGAKALSTHIDVYSLGAILYELLTGRPPFQAASPLDTVLQVLEREPDHPLSVRPLADRDLATICMKCLEKDPARRYGAAALLADDLDHWLSGEPISARAVGPIERGWRWCRRKPALASLAAAVVLALVGGAVVSTYFAIEAAARATQAEENARRADDNARRADDNARRADNQAREANRNAQLARDESAKAQAQRLRAERNAYAARAQLLQATWHEAQAGRGLKLLDEQRPAAGAADLRDFEWRLLARWWHSDLLSVAVGDYSANWLSKVAFSPDNRLLAAGSGKTVKVFNAFTGATKQTIRGPFEEVSGIAFSPDGKRLAVLTRGRPQRGKPGRFNFAPALVTVHDLAGGKQVVRFNCRDFWSYDLAYSPDGRLLAMASMGAIELHDSETGKSVRKK
jgi:hypothetical protein